MNDSRFITDLFTSASLGQAPLLNKMQELADADAQQLSRSLREAINTHHPKKIIIMTHVPPFKEACFYEGKMTDDHWLPYFSSKASGDVLEEIANANQTIEFLVLCGHTHSQARYQHSTNLLIKAGHAAYFAPQIQEMIVI